LAIFDLIIIGALVIAGIKGFRQGFIVETISFIAFFLGLFLALKLTFPIAMKFFGDVQAFWLIALIIFIALFFLVMWGAKLLASGLKNAIDLTFASLIDNVMGVIVSIFKWVFVLSVILWVFHSLTIEFPEKWTEDSHLYVPLSSLAPWSFEVFSGIIPFFQDILDSMDAPIRRI
jgi:membrane protein required for colicin V production